MIYVTFSVYLLGIVFAAMAVYRLWANLIKPRWVDWVVLPGTVVSEMAFIFGNLITGGEVRRARLIGADQDPPRRGKSSKSPEGQAGPATEAAPKLRFFGPVIAAFISLLACGAGIVAVHALLGRPVVAQFAPEVNSLDPGGQLKSLPTTTAQFWDQLKYQVDLLHRMSETWLELDWLNWRVPLFVYLAVCLSIRLAPIRRPLRASLIAVVAVAGNIALIGVIWNRFDGLMDDIWPLVTYVWSSLLFLLSASLIVRGAVGLIRALLQEQAVPLKSRAS